MSISIGNNVQFGNYCNISTDIMFGNNILMAGRVCFIGKHDHQFIESQQLIWSSVRGDSGITIISDDVWIGHNATIVGGVTIGRGSVIAAGAVVTSSIPECEIWGGVPARKIKNRFNTRTEMENHLVFLDSIKQQQFK